MDFNDLINDIDISVKTSAEVVRKTLPYGKYNYIDDRGYKHPGLLQNAAYKIKRSGENSWDVYIDLNISPYAEIINRPGYKTAEYWKNAARKVVELIAAQLGGELEA